MTDSTVITLLTINLIVVSVVVVALLIVVIAVLVKVKKISKNVDHITTNLVSASSWINPSKLFSEAVNIFRKSEKGE